MGLILFLASISLVLLISLIILIRYTLKETKLIPGLKTDFKKDPVTTVTLLILTFISTAGAVVAFIGVFQVLLLDIPMDMSTSDRLDTIFDSSGHDLILIGLIMLMASGVLSYTISRSWE